MRILKTITLVTAVNVMAVMPCLASKDQVLQRVHDAETKFTKKCDETEAIDWDLFRKLRNVEKELLVLKRANKTYLPTAVYSASTLKKGFDLSEMVGDDTIHVTEEYLYTPIDVTDGCHLDFEKAWNTDQVSQCDFYLGNPGKMHDDGYKSVAKIVSNGATIVLPAKIPKGDQLLFALVKLKNSSYFKFVFVVRVD